MSTSVTISDDEIDYIDDEYMDMTPKQTHTNYDNDTSRKSSYYSNNLILANYNRHSNRNNGHFGHLSNNQHDGSGSWSSTTDLLFYLFDILLN